MNGITVELAWIPSHCGIAGNETADQLAKRGSESEGTSADAFFLDYLSIPKQWLKRDWQQAWMEGEMGRLTFSMFPEISLTPWFKKGDYSRQEIVFINRIAANHYRRNAHLNRIEIVESPLCDCGQDYDTIDHAVWRCLNVNRTTIFRWSRKHDIRFGTSTRDLVGMRRFEALSELARLAKGAGLVI